MLNGDAMENPIK